MIPLSHSPRPMIIECTPAETVGRSTLTRVAGGLTRRFAGLLVLGTALLGACQADSSAPDPTPGPTPAAFVPKDEIIGSNFLQVEFSDDSRSMVWIEAIGGGRAKVYYADVNLTTGLPDLAGKQYVDTILGQGWPYWGADSQGPFFLLQNESGQLRYFRRSGTNTLTAHTLSPLNADQKSLLNVSHDPGRPYFWVSYVVKSSVASTKDSLFCLRSDAPGTRVFVAAEVKNTAGSAYELTFPRWLKNSETLLYPFRGNPAQPVFDIKLWNGQTGTSTLATNDGAAFHHVDDLAFALNGQQYLSSSRNAGRLTICQQQAGGLYTEIESHATPTAIQPYTLTSFEPFAFDGRVYGAYQVYAGGGIPGSTKGEIWLKGILGEPAHLKISTLDGVTVDPEYVVGPNKVWVYYYGKPVGQQTFDLHRCETPLTR
ncbi:hypothetical protein [Hymenobacter canadensis]|uniref:DUF4374 domain-containing protein n=1 Tax=Hymenobacter canadensis TaxID=2999067 RepID=A0ABY7LUQ3_9BACT|nr:hypothetical protein [Hymenobacter canadensis]WBA44121.1 hypothetical protein O3303_19725 [Hymenobacter canadensis]